MFGGGGEIRTLDTCEDILPFQGSALDHYATPPAVLLYQPTSQIYRQSAWRRPNLPRHQFLLLVAPGFSHV